MTVDTLIRAAVILFACIGFAVTLGALVAWLHTAAFDRQQRAAYRRHLQRTRDGYRPGPFEERR